jgi:Zn finger protein HypA/HybF involved in hydrogenase expression
MSLISTLLGQDLPVKGKKPNMACLHCGKCWNFSRPRSKKPCPRCGSKHTKAVTRTHSSYMGVS